LEVRFNVWPVQTGLLLPSTGVAGAEFIVTVTVPAGLVHPLTVTVTEYVPAFARVTFGMEGFCEVDVKVFGPVQLYVALGTVLQVKFNVAPIHNGELLPAVGVAGIGFTTTVTVPAGPVQPFTVAVTEYVPLAATVAFTMDGFCDVEVNPFGPVQL
jgi:hypothetical protein